MATLARLFCISFHSRRNYLLFLLLFFSKTSHFARVLRLKIPGNFRWCSSFAVVYGMANNDTNQTTVEYETSIRQGIEVIQSMIDISADRLEALRTQCATSAELTQQEIRTLETKLVRMFSELLVKKAKLSERLPKTITSTGAELKQWLRVVGMSAVFNSLSMQIFKSRFFIYSFLLF